MVQHKLTTADIWARLKEKYQKKNTITQARLWNELVRLQMSKDTSNRDVQETFDSFARLANKIQSSQISLPDILIVLLFRLGSMKFQSVVDVLALQPDITLDAALEALRTTSQRESDSHGSETTTNALIGRTTGKNRQSKSKSKSSKRPHSTGSNSNDVVKSKRICNHCNKSGHVADDCWKKHPEKTPDWLKEKSKGSGSGSGQRKKPVLHIGSE